MEKRKIELLAPAGDMERLEMALRNIFGVEVAGLRILSCVLPGERILLLGCPMLNHELETEEKNNKFKDLYPKLCNLATRPFYWANLEPQPGLLRFEKDSLIRSAPPGNISIKSPTTDGRYQRWNKISSVCASCMP